MRKHHKTKFEGMGFVCQFADELGEVANAGCYI